MRNKRPKMNAALLSWAEWTNSDWCCLTGCSVPIQKWTIPQLRLRLAHRIDSFHCRLAILKQLIKRCSSVERVNMFETQTPKEVIAAYPGVL